MHINQNLKLHCPDRTCRRRSGGYICVELNREALLDDNLKNNVRKIVCVCQKPTLSNCSYLLAQMDCVCLQFA
jgi:hypothetical protein